MSYLQNMKLDCGNTSTFFSRKSWDATKQHQKPSEYTSNMGYIHLGLLTDRLYLSIQEVLKSWALWLCTLCILNFGTVNSYQPSEGTSNEFGTGHRRCTAKACEWGQDFCKTERTSLYCRYRFGSVTGCPGPSGIWQPLRAGLSRATPASFHLIGCILPSPFVHLKNDRKL